MRSESRPRSSFHGRRPFFRGGGRRGCGFSSGERRSALAALAGDLIGVCIAVELAFLKGRERLGKIPARALVRYKS